MIDAFFTAMDPVMNDLLGSETVTLRRSLRLTRPDGSPAVDLKVAEGAVAGATSVRLSSPEGALSGFVGAGLELTIGGESYPIATDCQRSDDGTVLLSLASPLLADALTGDSATLTETVEWDLPHCLIYKPLDSVLSGDLVGVVSFAVSVPMSVAPQRPALGDIVGTSLGSGVILGFLTSDGGSVEPLVGRAGQRATESTNRQPTARGWA